MIVDATLKNITAFYGTGIGRTCRSWAIIDGDNVLCIFGYFRDGAANVIFSDSLPEIRSHAMTIMRAAKILMSELNKKGLPILAQAEEKFEASERFLHRLGFTQPYSGVKNGWRK